MMVLVEPTRAGGSGTALICTECAPSREIVAEFPPLAPHNVLKKWLYIDSQHAELERTLNMG